MQTGAQNLWNSVQSAVTSSSVSTHIQGVLTTVQTGVQNLWNTMCGNSTSSSAQAAASGTATQVTVQEAPPPEKAAPTYKDCALFTQHSWDEKLGEKFGKTACAATSTLNDISMHYTQETGEKLSAEKAVSAMQAAVEAGAVDKTDAFVNSWENAANAMAESVGLQGSFTYVSDPAKATDTIYAFDYKKSSTDSNPDGVADHFIVCVDSNDKTCYNCYDGSCKTVGEVTADYKANYGGSCNVSTRCLSYSTGEE